MIDKSLVRAAILQYVEDNYGEGFGAFENYSYAIGKEFEVAGLGVVRIVDSKGYDYNKSYDGWSEDLHVVFDVQGTLYMAKGTYTSYIGSEWANELIIVTPKTRQVTFYEED